MKWIICLVCVSLLMIFDACSTPEEDYKKSTIDKFGQQLTVIIQNRDSKGYVNLLPKSGDKWLNIKTKKASELPVNDEALNKNVKKVAEAFELTLRTLESAMGNLADAKIEKIEYIIDADRRYSDLGIFKFDICLRFSNSEKVTEVWQRSCVMSTRGILVANDLAIK